MIAHVAQRGEDRGRVVIRLGCSGAASAAALEAAVSVAQAFNSEIESLFVEDRQLYDLVAYEFVREISTSGRTNRALAMPELEREMQLTAQTLLRQVEDIARRAGVPVRRRIVRDEPVRALATACAASGPWNVVVLAEPFSGRQASKIKELFESVWGTTGLVVVGPRAKKCHGPVVVLVEDIERLAGMLRTAERLSSVSGGEVKAVLVGDQDETLSWMEGQARLALGRGAAVKLEVARPVRGHPGAVAGLVQRLGGCFVVAQFGGTAVPASGDLGSLAAVLECPLFLVR